MSTLALAVLAAVAACAGNGGTAPPAVQLQLRPGNVSILTGDTIRVSATGSTAGAGEGLTWTSSDPGVATVDAGGLVTAIGQGAVTITAAAPDGSGETRFWVSRGSGTRIPELAAFDSIIPRVMREWDIPGGAVAVASEGRLVLARGYGLADPADGVVASPDHLFRIASVSKPITAVAILKLHQEGRLDLDAAAFSLLPDLEPPEGASPDPRLSQITIRQLLHHAGGWNRNDTFDPMFRPIVAAEAVGEPAPASAETVIRYMMGEPLQFDPGQQYAYSNLGYAILGRIIERVTGQPYDEYVKVEILAPAGISRMEIGSSLPEGRAEGEASYIDPAVVSSVFQPHLTVPIADGGFHLEAMDAHGGWIASPVDLLRFLTAVDADGAGTLDGATTTLMLARPPAPLWAASQYWYGMGWLVRPSGGDANWWHDGSLPGTTALLVRAHNGLAWAALFNARASDQNGSFAAALDQAVWKAVNTVTQWPETDAFDQHD